MNMARHARSGFTLIEILIVVAIMGALMGFFFGIVPRVTRAFNTYKVNATISEVKSGLTQYQLSVGKYPQKLKDLIKPPKDETERKKWKRAGGPFLQELPIDPWGNKYVYKLTPGGKHPYELYSYGSQGPGSPKDDWITAW